MAKDLFHNTVKTALQKDGWQITHDPYQLRYEVRLITYDPNQEVIDRWIE